MRHEQLSNKPKESTAIIHKYQPQVERLECSKEEIIAFLNDGRKLSIPLLGFLGYAKLIYSS